MHEASEAKELRRGHGLGKVYEPVFFIHRGRRYLIMSWFYWQEYKPAINNLLTNYGFTYSVEVQTLIDQESDVVEISQELQVDGEPIEIVEQSFYWH